MKVDYRTCPKCGSLTSTYRHPYAKVWCDSCGFVLREEGGKDRVIEYLNRPVPLSNNQESKPMNEPEDFYQVVQLENRPVLRVQRKGKAISNWIDVKDLLRERDELRAKLERVEKSEESAFSVLELYGVPRSRAHTVDNGIMALVTRIEREIDSLRYQIIKECE